MVNDTVLLAEMWLYYLQRYGETEVTDLVEAPHGEGAGQAEGWSSPRGVCGVGGCLWEVTLALA